MNKTTDTSYSPVPWVYREIIEEAMAKQTEGKIFYFCSEETLCSVAGIIVKLEEIPGEGLFIRLAPEARVRIDRIITLFGKPGAAYDAYDAYANACLDCTGGYDL